MTCYEAVGGEPTFRKLVDEFYAGVAGDPVLRPMYPEDDPDFIAEVNAEARYQVRRLRSHPSLALWCGNNENQWIHDRTFPERHGAPVPGARWYDEVLPRIWDELSA